MNKLPLVLLFISAVNMAFGCASPPKTHSFNPVATCQSDFDAVWSAVVEYFAITSLPIDTIEKDSGLIVTSWMDASTGEAVIKPNGRYCDCGKGGLFSTDNWVRGKFNVYVKSRPDGETDLRVTCTYQIHRTAMEVAQTINCKSTGYLETQIQDYVKAKIAGGVVPEIPVFSPSEES